MLWYIALHLCKATQVRACIVAVYEATAIERAENAVGSCGELQTYYPPATHMSDHPFCVLQTEWVAPEETQAVQLFVDYLSVWEMQ